MTDQGPPNPEENPYVSPSYQQYQPAPPQQPPLYGPPQPGMYGPMQPALPEHPQAGTAFVLGLVSVVGGFFCGLPIFAGPFAWVMGARVRTEIDREPHRYGGRQKAVAGMIMGIVATGLAALALLVVGAAIVVIILAEGS